MLACASVAVGMSWHSQCQFSDVALANIEAIASGEGGLQAPCSKRSGEECTFDVIDADGNQGEETWKNYIYQEIK